MKLRDIAARLSCTLEGDGDIEIDRVSGLEGAVPGDLTFFGHRKYLDELRQTKASAVIVPPGVTDVPAAVLRADDALGQEIHVDPELGRRAMLPLERMVNFRR